MYSQTRKYFRFRYRVIFVAFLLISPTASSAPEQDSASVLPGLEQCAAIVSAFISAPDEFSKNPDRETIKQRCIQVFPQIWEMMKHAKGPILYAGLVFVSGYLLYESNQLYERTKALQLNLTKYTEDFKLLKVELKAYNDSVKKELKDYKDYIEKDIEPSYWRNGNTAKMVRKLEKTIGKLLSYANKLKELAENIRKDILQGHGDEMWSVQLPVCSGIVCVSSLFTVFPPVIILTCGFCALAGYWSVQSHYSLKETREQQSKLLNNDILELRKEITKTRTNLELLKMRVDINM